MTSPASAPTVVAAVAGATPDLSHVFASRAVGGRAVALVARVDPGFLAEAGWDAASLVLSPPQEHPLLGRPVCRVQGCSTTAPTRGRICASCRHRLVERGLPVDELELLGARSDPARGPGGCVVAGCAREWVSSRHMLCRAHREQAETLQIPTVEFATHRAATPLASCGPCAVAACVRQRRHPDGCYCEAHQLRLRLARRHDPGLDEARWRLTETPVGRGGQVSFRGLAPAVVAEVLVGLQQRSRLDGVKTKEGDLRRLCSQLRGQQVTTLAEFVMPADPDGTFRALGNAVVAHARRALATPDTEVVKDEWDLVVFGHSGTLSFTAITQPWLREVAKRWAAGDLPNRRSATSKVGLVVRHDPPWVEWRLLGLESKEEPCQPEDRQRSPRHAVTRPRRRSRPSGWCARCAPSWGPRRGR